jgi:16S rRNA (guanine527-N7)-methyltransferase
LQRERLAERSFALFGVELNATALDQLAVYERELLAWNAERANLTAITDPDAVETRHFLDSISLLGCVEFARNARVVDVGTGAGFPGLALKIIRPDLHVTLIDSVGKKTAFLMHMVKMLRLDNVRVLTVRAEDAGQDAAHREAYDLAVARAVAYLPTLVEYLLPLCRVGGCCVAMKGESAAQEVEEAAFALETLGGRVAGMHRVVLPETDENHQLVVIEKVRPTPPSYPRPAGRPTKRPLRRRE